MGREVRMVPPDWDHPTDRGGSLRPLHYRSLAEDLAEWEENKAQWEKGLRRDYGDKEWEPLDGSEGTFEGWYGKRPNQYDYMPDWPAEQRTHYQMYEDTSDGTPISPIFATPEELARWLVDNNASAFGDMTASYESWLRICKGGYAPGMVYSPQTGLVNGVDGSAK